MGAESIVLHGEAELLYQDLGGIHKNYADEILLAEEQRRNRHRSLFVDISHILSSFFESTRLLHGTHKMMPMAQKLYRKLEQLNELPGCKHGLSIRFKGGAGGTKDVIENDYTIKMGSLSVNTLIGDAMSKEGGIAMTHISGRLRRSFEIFSELNISNLQIEPLPPGLDGPEAAGWKKTLYETLIIISRYKAALQNNNAIVYEKNGRKQLIPLIHDENGAVDINLTILAGINGLTLKQMQMLVEQAAKRMDDIDAGGKGTPCISVYDFLLNNKKMRRQLVKPSIEINSLKWFVRSQESSVISKEKAKISRLAMKAFQGAPMQSAQAVQCLYSNDFHSIRAESLSRRLMGADKLLQTMTAQQRQAGEKEIFGNIRKRFNDIQETVFDDLVFEKDGLKLRKNNRLVPVGRLHSKLQKFLFFYKGRVAAHRKLRQIIREEVVFTPKELKALAIDFGISAEDVKRLIRLMQDCFEWDGRFNRAVFENHIPQFAQFESKVFKFLWHYLKEIPSRRDRLAFINALQLLISRMKQPFEAVRILLSDILSSPEDVSPSDRDAFMLCNLLVRTYNQELNIDIEMTPEEVLQVRNGINRDLIKKAAAFVTSRYDDFLKKAAAVANTITEALDYPYATEMETRIRGLFFLEREMLIFFALTGGYSSSLFLKNALQQYGISMSDVYFKRHWKERLCLLIQHLNVIVRCFERQAAPEDIDLLMQVEEGKSHFISCRQDDLTLKKIERLSTNIGIAAENIRMGAWDELYYELRQMQ